MNSLSPRLMDVNDTANHPGEGRSGWQQSLQDGVGSPARSSLLAEDGGAGPVPPVHALLLLLLSWASVCWSLLCVDLSPQPWKRTQKPVKAGKRQGFLPAW